MQTKPNRQPPVDRLTPIEIETLLNHCVRSPEIFLLARDRVKPDLFVAGVEEHYRLLWEVALELEQEHKLAFLCNPDGTEPFTVMYEVIVARLHKRPDTLTPAQRLYVLGDGSMADPGWLRVMFSPMVFNVKRAKSQLIRFMRERAVHDKLLNQLVKSDGVQRDLLQVLQGAKDVLSSTEMIGGDPTELALPDDFQPENIIKMETGINFVDLSLNGGQVRGETYGILGAYGSGKTSIACQLLASCASRCQERAVIYTDQTGVLHRPDECFFFHYEAPILEVRQRLIASTALIHHDHALDMKNYTSKVNGWDSLHTYEKQYWKQQYIANGECPNGEKERYAAAQKVLRVNARIIDMSGQKEGDARLGTGYLQELRTIIDNKMRILAQQDAETYAQDKKDYVPRQVGVVIIDYAGICATRHMAANNIDMNQLRHYVGRFGDVSRTEISLPLATTTWVFHQLSATANARTSNTRQHYTDAAEAKNFAENLNFCFALGTKEEESGTLLWNTSKARRAQLHLPPVLVQEGQFFRLVRSDTHVYDPKSRSVVPREVLAGSTSKPKVSPSPYEQAMPTGMVNAQVGDLPTVADPDKPDIDNKPIPLNKLASSANLE